MEIPTEQERPSRIGLLPRFPLVALGMMSLFTAIWGGLVRMGWAFSLPEANWITFHGHLMVSGFLGTLISLERAVGMDHRVAYAVPGLGGAGAACIVVGVLGRAPAVLMTLASVGLVILSVIVVLRQRELFTITMAAGAGAWLVSNVLWLLEWRAFDLVPWWGAFLVLTIAGERLELTRFLRPSGLQRRTFLATALLLVFALGLTLHDREAGGRIYGLALVALGAWLLVHDIARRTVRQRGLPRFVAVCLLGGYVWLIIAGLLLAGHGLPEWGLTYDGILHSLFLGFGFSMIFGHAPIIFPAVLRVPVRYHAGFYVHVLLLQLSLVLRVVSDLALWFPGRMAGGLVGAIAIAVFLLNTMGSAVFPAPRSKAPVGRGTGAPTATGQ